jgi:hypothetical protein
VPFGAACRLTVVPFCCRITRLPPFDRFALSIAIGFFGLVT